MKRRFVAALWVLASAPVRAEQPLAPKVEAVPEAPVVRPVMAPALAAPAVRNAPLPALPAAVVPAPAPAAPAVPAAAPGPAAADASARALAEQAVAPGRASGVFDSAAWPVTGTTLVVGGRREAGHPAPQPDDQYLDIDPTAHADVTGDIRATRFPAESFEKIYFERFPHSEFSNASLGTFSETSRILKVGGRLIIETGGKEFPAEQIFPVLPAAGFKDIRFTLRDQNANGGIGLIVDIEAVKGNDRPRQASFSPDRFPAADRDELARRLTRDARLDPREAAAIARWLIGAQGHRWRLELHGTESARRLLDFRAAGKAEDLERRMGRTLTWPEIVLRDDPEIHLRAGSNR